MSLDAAQIRPSVPLDAPAIIASINAICAEGGAYYITEFVPDEQWRTVFYQPELVPDHLLAVAEYAGQIIGMVNLFPELGRPFSYHVLTLGIHVAAGYRRQGLGSRLLRYGINWAEAAGFEKIGLQVFGCNVAAQALYRKFDFFQEGILRRQIKQSGHYDDTICLARFLPA